MNHLMTNADLIHVFCVDLFNIMYLMPLAYGRRI